MSLCKQEIVGSITTRDKNQPVGEKYPGSVLKDVTDDKPSATIPKVIIAAIS